MQQPSCANCVRRDENCHYPNVLDGESSHPQHVNHSSYKHVFSDGRFEEDQSAEGIPAPTERSAVEATHTR